MWVAQILIGFATLLMTVLSLTLLVSIKAKHDLKAKYPPPGTMVDVGGYRLHILCEGTGSPTVIMESGLGEPSLNWALIRPDVANTTRVCIYDRAGLGWSDLSPRPRTAENIVKDLHTLLTNAGIAGPYVLVGHSIGGAYMRLFAHTYPDEVVGMVLVDSAHEEQILRAPEPFAEFNRRSTQQTIRQLETYKPLVAIGIFALVPSWVPVDAQLPQADRKAYQALAARSADFLQTVIAEEKAIDESFAQVRAARITTVGNIPLIVLSRGQSVVPPDAGLSPEVIQQANLGWQQMQTELALLSPKGKWKVAEQSGHYIHLQQPLLVIEAIKQVVADVRQRSVLGQR